MPAWLSPRVRLGVTASLIVLIACAIVLTPYLFHDDDAEAPDTLTSEIVSVDLPAPAPPATRSLKQPLFMPVPSSVPRELSWPTRVDIWGSDGESASSPDTSSEPEIDWLGPNPLVSQGIAWPGVNCSDCDRPPRQSFQPGVTLFFGLGAGAALDGGGVAAGPTSLPFTTETDGEPTTTAANGPGDQGPNSRSGALEGGGGPGPSNPHGQPVGPTGLNGANGPNGPADPDGPKEPDPLRPGAAQVPEPASFVVAGLGALGFMIRARLAHKRRG